MTGQLDVIREGKLGIIALNRPEAINALNLEMVEGITRTLEQWRHDDGIRLIRFEGRGPRGFCSGGDVRAARAAVLAGRPEQADAFFAAEYRMNGLVATYPKPLVALSHGIVMGGGIGIAGHCGFRFTTTDARFAMPEAAIGFISDVGSNFILAKAVPHRALAFLMAGVPVGAADALALGLADCVIDPAEFDTVRAGIAAAAEAADVATALAVLMQARMAPTGEAVFCAAADRLAAHDLNDAAAIVAAAGTDPLLAPLKRRSPTSLVAIHRGHQAARRMATVERVLALELRLAGYMARQPDFAEGVRAVLVDKDQNPQWRPSGLPAVDEAAILAVIGGSEAPAEAHT